MNPPAFLTLLPFFISHIKRSKGLGQKQKFEDRYIKAEKEIDIDAIVFEEY